MASFDDYEDEELPRFHEEIEAHELVAALTGLTLLGDDLAMRSQAFNIAMVDKFIMELEMNYLRSHFNDDVGRQPGTAAFLSAQTEMWIFAAYELMRSWRERAKLSIKLAENGGLGAKISHLLARPPWDHGSLMVARQLTRVRDEPEILPRIRDDLLRSHIPFHLLEWVRVQLAKYQEPGNEKSFVRSHPMMDRETGSLNYELTRGPMILETLSRRQLADSLRGLNDMEVPSQETITAFESFRKTKPPIFDPC